MANSAGTASPASLRAVSSRAGLERFLEDVRFAQSASEDRLSRLSEAVAARKRISELGAARQRLQGSDAAASAVSALFDSAAKAGEDTRSRIEDVLVLYERARQAREFVDSVIVLRESIQGIHGAMEIRDWERAATLASHALAVPSVVVDSEFAARMAPSAELPDAPRQTLEAACDDLAALFVREFDKATAARQMDQVTRHFKLFPLIGRSNLGLERYAQFIRQIIAGLSRVLLASGSPKDNPTFYGAALSKLFENVATIIGQHSPLVTRHYGPDAMPDIVMPRIQQEVDKQAGLIIDTFWDERRIEMLIVSCRQYSFPFLLSSFSGRASTGSDSVTSETGDAADSAADLQVASTRLSELSTMLNRCALYRGFLEQRWPDHSRIIESLSGSMVQRKVSDILGPTFSTLSLFVFRRSVEKAVELDELPSKASIDAHTTFNVEAPLVSSLVDDVMYVFSTVLAQTVDTGDEKTMDSAFAGLRRVLESDFIGTLQRKLRSTAPSSEVGGAGAFMIYLNDLEVTAAYVAQAIDRVLAEGRASAATAETLSKFKTTFRSRTSELLADGCQTFAAIRIAPQAQIAATSSFKVAAYTTTDAAEGSGRRNGAAFETQWRQLLRPLLQLLHPAVLNGVLDIACRSVASALEKFVWSLERRITEIGCVVLDRDLSLVIAVTSETQYSLRQRFVKVAQIVNALTDDMADIDALSQAEQARLRSFVVGY